MLTLQEDEVEWGDGASDPALQHALAVIKAKGDMPHLTFRYARTCSTYIPCTCQVFSFTLLCA